jgi:hypothetical protein
VWCSTLLVSTGIASYARPVSSRKSTTFAGFGVGAEVEVDRDRLLRSWVLAIFGSLPLD